MGTTAVQICNEAIAHVRGSRIVSLDDETETARACKLFYESKKRELLESHPWNFAMTRAELTVTTETSVDDVFENIYLLPGQCLTVWEVLGYTKADQYQVEDGRIHINDSGPIYIRYVRDVSADRFSQSFASALALLLAVSILPTIQNSTVKADTLMRRFERMALPAAKRHDAIQNPPEEPVPDEWDLARQA